VKRNLLPALTVLALAPLVSLATAAEVVPAHKSARKLAAAAEASHSVVSDDCYYGASYGSFNRKIVAVGNKWFMPYRTGQGEEGTFRLMTSEDTGRTWSELYADDRPSYQCPSMVADDQGRLHLTCTYKGQARHLRFSPGASGRYRLDAVKEFGAAAVKSSLAFDQKRQRLYYSHRFGSRLAVAALGLDGKLKFRTVLIEAVGKFPPKGHEPCEDAHYHSMSVGADGVLHLIYTRTVYWRDERGQVAHRYAGVYYLRSKDGARTWSDARGAALALPAPMKSGTQIHLPQNDDGKNPIWGESLAADTKHAHVLYFAFDPKSGRPLPHYARVDADGAIGARSLPPIVALHSALSLDPKTGDLFAFGTNQKRQPTLLRSERGGEAWRVVSAITDLPLRVPYAHTTCEQVTGDGFVLAALTDLPAGGDQSAVTMKKKLYFFRFGIR